MLGTIQSLTFIWHPFTEKPEKDRDLFVKDTESRYPCRI